MKKVLLTVTAVILSATLAYAQTEATPAKSKEAIKEEIKAQVEKVKAACSADYTTMGCAGEGKEKAKCVREYKKSHKDFKFSDACKSAMKDGREMRAERKKMRKEAHKAKKEANEAKSETK